VERLRVQTACDDGRKTLSWAGAIDRAVVVVIGRLGFGRRIVLRPDGTARRIGEVVQVDGAMDMEAAAMR
jgi:hypothetical protein